MKNYKLDMTGEEINNTLKSVENKAEKTEIPTTTSSLINDSTFTTLAQVTELISKNSGGSGNGFGIEVVTVPRNSSGISTVTLAHPAIAVIASNGRSVYYDELSSITTSEYNQMVILTPGDRGITCANSTNRRDDELTLSADGKTLTLTTKGYSCTCICFYQL